MRRTAGLALVLVCAAGGAAAANKLSNPAFLGVGMDDAGGVRGAGPCTITSVERGSGAEAAALQPGDIFEKLDGAAILNCDALVQMITARTPGTTIALDLRRHAMPLKVRAELLTRDEILRRRLVNRPAPSAELVRVGDGSATELDAIKRTTIVAWFPMACAGCDAILADVVRWTRDPAAKRPPIAVVAATADLAARRPRSDYAETLRPAQRNLEAPLLVADHDTYMQFAMRDVDRVHFMVIDGRGTITYVAPIVPNTDDTAAVLDELYAAAEQAARRTAR